MKRQRERPTPGQRISYKGTSWIPLSGLRPMRPEREAELAREIAETLVKKGEGKYGCGERN